MCCNASITFDLSTTHRRHLRTLMESHHIHIVILHWGFNEYLHKIKIINLHSIFFLSIDIFNWCVSWEFSAKCKEYFLPFSCSSSKSYQAERHIKMNLVIGFNIFTFSIKAGRWQLISGPAIPPKHMNLISFFISVYYLFKRNDGFTHAWTWMHLYR